jgi:hypothetical protein
MTTTTSDAPMFIDTAPENRLARSADDEETSLERQMNELGLSNETRRFLRKLHVAEKRLNEAFETVHRGGDPEAQVSRLYHDLYRTG